MNSDEIQYVDLVFRIMGKTIPADHGYSLYSAISHLIPSIHERKDILIKTLPGVLDGVGRLALPPRIRLRIRLPVNFIPEAYKLAGQSLEIGREKIKIGIPQIQPLRPFRNLYARTVVIRGFLQPDVFIEAVQRQLNSYQIKCKLSLYPETRSSRRTLRIKDYTVIGFGVLLENLSDEDSIKVQTGGLGGKKKMGCGFFLPARGQQ